jgi:hypothetical protein
LEVRFRVLTAVGMKARETYVTLCSFVEVDRRFRGATCLYLHISREIGPVLSPAEDLYTADVAYPSVC